MLSSRSTKGDSEGLVYLHIKIPERSARKYYNYTRYILGVKEGAPVSATKRRAPIVTHEKNWPMVIYAILLSKHLLAALTGIRPDEDSYTMLALHTERTNLKRPQLGISCE